MGTMLTKYGELLAPSAKSEVITLPHPAKMEQYSNVCLAVVQSSIDFLTQNTCAMLAII